MLYSPSLMSQLPIVSIDTLNKGKNFPVFQWRGTWSAWVEFVRACMADESAAGGDLRSRMRESFPDSWSGITDTFEDWQRSGTYAQAYSEFQRAEAKLEADRFQPGAMRPAVAGGAWIVPLALAGNPMPARIRERTKLPPKNLELAVSVSCVVDWEDISHSMAKIARASWDYLQAGGAVRVTVNYCYAFSKAQGEARGALFSIDVPLTSASAFASAASAQEFRGASLCMAQSLSGLKGDSLPLIRYAKPGILDITGRVADDEKACAVLRIA